MKFFLFFTFVFLVLASAMASRSDCPKFCPRHVAIVCAKDGHGTPKEFVNECLMKMDNCNKGQNFNKIKEGHC